MEANRILTTRYKTTTWQEYWKLFDHLVDSLNKDKKKNCAKEFLRAQNNATGMKDGWFDFLEEFKIAIIKNESELTIQQREIADYLTKSLMESFTKMI